LILLLHIKATSPRRPGKIGYNICDRNATIPFVHFHFSSPSLVAQGSLIMDLKISGWFLCFSYLDRRFCTKSFFRSPVNALAKVVPKVPLWGNGRMMDVVMEHLLKLDRSGVLI